MDRGTKLLIFTWILCFFTILFASTRVYARRRPVRDPWWEDTIAAFTLTCCLTFDTIWTVYACSGYAEHCDSLTPYNLFRATQLSSISQTFGILGIASSQVSVCLMIQRMQALHAWRVRISRFISGGSCTVAVPVAVLLLTQGNPFDALAIEDDGSVKCLNEGTVNIYYVFASSYFAMANFVLVALLSDIVWHLQTKKHKKFPLIFIIGFTSGAGAIATLKSIRSFAVLQSVDKNWAIVEFFLYDSLQINLSVGAASIPFARLILVALRSRNKSFTPAPRRGQTTELRPIRMADQTHERRPVCSHEVSKQHRPRARSYGPNIDKYSASVAAAPRRGPRHSKRTRHIATEYRVQPPYELDV